MTVAVFSESDLFELLGDEPELFALADAIAVTGVRRPRRTAVRLFAAASAAALLATLALASPWQSAGNRPFVDRALAAIGSGPVLHVVLEHQSVHELVAVDLRTGQERPLPATTEIWFDKERDAEHTVSRIGGQLTGEALQWRTRVVTSRGSYPSGVPPWLDPALREFADGYRSALSSGRAKRDGDGVVDGKPVTWLRFGLEHGYQRVAVDAQTSLPIRVVTYWGGAPTAYAVRLIETLPAGSGNFVPPRVDEPEPESYSRVPVHIAPKAAPRVIPGALAVGSSFGGLPLVKVVETTLSTIFKPAEHAAPRVAKGLEFDYGTDRFVGDEPFLIVSETAEPQEQNGWFDAPLPRPGEVVVGVDTVMLARAHWSGLTVKDGVYVTLLAPTRESVLAAARALQPFAP
jgi:hypothetical protein